MRFVRRKITPDAVQPPNTRYNPDCDCVQTSPDGGTTWVDNPAADPRYADSFRLPVREGSDPRCDAAEAMMQHFRAQVDAFLTAASVLSFVNAAIQLAGIFFGPIGIFSSKLFAIFEALTTLGTVAVDAAMTETVYDQIKCILYCNIDGNGQMSAAQLMQAQTQVDTEIGGIPNIIFDLFAGLWGPVEWSNAGAVGEYTGDCDLCECESCITFDFAASDWGWSIDVNGGDTYGQWVSGQGFMAAVGGSGYVTRVVSIHLPFDVTNATRYQIDYYNLNPFDVSNQCINTEVPVYPDAGGTSCFGIILPTQEHDFGGASPVGTFGIMMDRGGASPLEAGIGRFTIWFDGEAPALGEPC